MLGSVVTVVSEMENLFLVRQESVFRFCGSYLLVLPDQTKLSCLTLPVKVIYLHFVEQKVI